MAKLYSFTNTFKANNVRTVGRTELLHPKLRATNNIRIVCFITLPYSVDGNYVVVGIKQIWTTEGTQQIVGRLKNTKHESITTKQVRQLGPVGVNSVVCFACYIVFCLFI